MVQERADEGGVSVEAFFHSQPTAARAIEMAKDVLSRLTQAFGPYPHKTLTLVESFSSAEPDSHPGIVVLPRGSVAVIELGDLLVYNADVIRQIARQWWTDSPQGDGDPSELARPIREGLAEWATWWYLEQINDGELVKYPIDWPLFPRPTEREFQLTNYYRAMLAGVDSATVNIRESRLDATAYAVHSRIYPAVVLRMVEGIVGEAAFLSALRRVYAEPAGGSILSQFASALAEAAQGVEVTTKWSSFLRSWLVDSPSVDYGVSQVEWDEKQAHILLERRGDGIVPVDVKVSFESGMSLNRRWDGRSQQFDMTFPERVKAVEVDPNRTVPDLHRANNRWPGPAWNIQLFADAPKPGERVASLLPTIGASADGSAALGLTVRLGEGMPADSAGVRALDISANWSPTSRGIGWALSYKLPWSTNRPSGSRERPSGSEGHRLNPIEHHDFVLAAQGHLPWTAATPMPQPFEWIPADRTNLSIGVRTFRVRILHSRQSPGGRWQLGTRQNGRGVGPA